MTMPCLILSFFRYNPLPSNGTEATPTIAAAREAIAATVANSVFHAPTADKSGPQLGISGRRLENGRVFSGVFQMGFVNPNLKFAVGLLWDALAGSGSGSGSGGSGSSSSGGEIGGGDRAGSPSLGSPGSPGVSSALGAVKQRRLELATQIIDEWVRTSDGGSSPPDAGGGMSDLVVGASGGANLSHVSWSHGVGPVGCCPGGTKQGDGCPIVNNTLRCTDPSQPWTGAGKWVDDDGRFGDDPKSDSDWGGVVWVRRLAEGHSLVLQAVQLMAQSPVAAAGNVATWEAWVAAGAESLLHLQRPDGSWGRASRRLQAGPTDPPLDSNPLLDSADTLFPVYFLADAAKYYAKSDPVKAKRFLKAALRGGEMAWSAYGRHGMYVAGDYVPSIDKEAALFALRAYLSLAEAATGHDGKPSPTWVQRASDTALFCDTMHYQVNLPLAADRPRTSPYSHYNDWARDWYEGQTTVGLGFIELGHSGVDTTGSEFVPELLRLFELTQDPAVLNQALIQVRKKRRKEGRGGWEDGRERNVVNEWSSGMKWE